MAWEHFVWGNLCLLIYILNTNFILELESVAYIMPLKLHLLTIGLYLLFLKDMLFIMYWLIIV